MSQKRPHNGWEPASKRQHFENGYAKSEPSKEYHQPKSLPPLPPITPQYEAQVFTHKSALTPTNSGNDVTSYDRLEFLGDAYVELFASKLIWEKFPTLPTGKMSQLRETLVKNETLAQLSSAYGFDKKLQGTGMMNQPFDQKSWTKIKGDMFEAYIAAIVLSDPTNGPETAERWITKLWKPRLPAEKILPDMQAKVQLSGKIGGKGVTVSYVEERKPAYEKGHQTFFLGAYLTGWGWDNQHLGSGKGPSKHAAGNNAAARALQNSALLDKIIAVRSTELAKRNADDTKEDMPE